MRNGRPKRDQSAAQRYALAARRALTAPDKRERARRLHDLMRDHAQPQLELPLE